MGVVDDDDDGVSPSVLPNDEKVELIDAPIILPSRLDFCSFDLLSSTPNNILNVDDMNINDIDCRI